MAMLLDYPYAQGYAFGALDGAADHLDILLEALSDGEADYRPDPDRFTIREIVAHLADWDPVFLMRMQRMLTESHPVLEGYDEGQWCIDHDYATSNVEEQLALFRERRSELAAFVKARRPEDWGRSADRPEIGTLTIEALALLIPLHDSYHFRQILDWRNRFHFRTR